VAKRDLLKLPGDFEANVRALLGTPPAPPGTAGSRKASPKPPAKPKARKGYRRTKGEAAAHRAAMEQRKQYSYELARVIKEGTRPKRKAAKKR
jgi:hypothetical protein